LAWNHDDVGPNRSRDELLGDVVRRGERIRRHRRAFAGLGGSIAVLLAVAGVAAVVGQGAEPATQLAAVRPSTTVVSGTGPGGATGGTVLAVDATTTTAAPEEATPTTARPVATTAASVEETVPPTTEAPQPTIPGPAQPRCSPANVQATLTLAPTYAAGQPVSGQAVLRNTSGAPCYYASYTQSQEITDAGGNPVAPGGTLIADAFADTPFNAGQTLSAHVDWNQQVCVGAPDCHPAPPGSYTATVTWSFDGPPVTATATFAITP
jgi:hypothetical protein